MRWELDFGVCVQSNHLHLAVLLPWQFLGYKFGMSRLHILPPLLAIKVNYVLRMVEKEGIRPTAWIHDHFDSHVSSRAADVGIDSG